MSDPGIVRNRAKIVSAINNARRACELVQETGSLARWLWAFEPCAEERPAVVDMAYWTANPTSPASLRLSKALKKRGWTFVGPTTMYALMQAMGMVNDHLRVASAARALNTYGASSNAPESLAEQSKTVERVCSRKR